MKRRAPKDENPARRRRPRNNYIVHDGRRFVYLWLQKVACSSVKDALLPLFGIDPAPFARTWPDGTIGHSLNEAYRVSGFQVPRARFLKELDGRYAGYHKFGFVRNPFDRLVSCYRDKIDRPPEQGVPGYIARSARSVGEEFYPRMPFAEFARIVRRVPDRWADGHFRSQHKVLCDRDGNVAADFVGRFENLAEDFGRVKDAIGAPEISLSSRNRGAPRGSYRDHYDDDLRDLVAERYRRDLEVFGYSF